MSVGETCPCLEAVVLHQLRTLINIPTLPHQLLQEDVGDLLLLLLAVLLGSTLLEKPHIGL